MWQLPVDPACPVVQRFYAGISQDPYSRLCPCMDEIIEDWEKKHRCTCQRCREHACAHVEIEPNY